jgi:NAD(P)-dependent dehydrogenase (short-subunit alcohol dehydrogenase family)
MLQKETQHRARSQRRIPLAGHFYFTKLLLPLLTVTAKNSPQKSVRVVNVSSIGHYVVPPDGIQWSTLSPGEDYLAMGKKIGALKLYGQSKLVRKRRLFFYISRVLFNIPRCRATSSSRTNLLGYTAAKASCPSLYIPETSIQISHVMRVLS